MAEPAPDDDPSAQPPRLETILDEQISAAPEPLRSYIRELERQADPASSLRELVCGREQRKMLGLAILELEQAIRNIEILRVPTSAGRPTWSFMSWSTCREVSRVPGITVGTRDLLREARRAMADVTFGPASSSTGTSVHWRSRHWNPGEEMARLHHASR